MSLSVRISIPAEPCPDAVRQLIANTEAGIYSLIRYNKNGDVRPPERLIEPRRLMDGPGGMMVRALQLKPEKGLRTFYASRITSVAPAELQIPGDARKRNTFCTGEIVAFQCNRPDFESMGDTPQLAGRPIWSQRWFSDYVSAIRSATLDLEINEIEREEVTLLQQSINLTAEQLRAAHAYVLAEEMLAYAADGRVDANEAESISRLSASLAAIGWSPLA